MLPEPSITNRMSGVAVEELTSALAHSVAPSPPTPAVPEGNIEPLPLPLLPVPNPPVPVPLPPRLLPLPGPSGVRPARPAPPSSAPAQPSPLATITAQQQRCAADHHA